MLRRVMLRSRESEGGKRRGRRGRRGRWGDEEEDSRIGEQGGCEQR
jgi:hypothetical protein